MSGHRPPLLFAILSVLTVLPACGTFALHAAASKGDASRVSKLLSDGARVDMHNRRGWVALHYAAANGHLDAVRVLLANGAKADEVTPGGGTALYARRAYGEPQRYLAPDPRVRPTRTIRSHYPLVRTSW